MVCQRRKHFSIFVTIKIPEVFYLIEKMKFLSITGPKADIDRLTKTYLSKYEIHLESALSELTDVANLSPFLEITLTGNT